MKAVEILNTEQIHQKLNRLAYEIYEHTLEENEIMLAGIEGNGYLVAKRLSVLLKKISGQEIILGKITLDKKNPLAVAPKIDFEEKDYKNKVVILVDDVLNSGKTLIYAVQLFLN